MADEIMNALIGYYGSKKAQKGSKQASKIIGQTADENIALAKDIYGQNIQGYQPFAQFGYGALQSYQDALNQAKQGDYSAFMESPENKVARDTALNMANRSLAQRGNALGGTAVRDLARLGADLGASQYGNYMNRMRGDIGIGSPAIGSIAGERTNMLGTIIPQNIMKGEAKAGSKIVGGNIWAKYMEDLVKGFS